MKTGLIKLKLTKHITTHCIALYLGYMPFKVCYILFNLHIFCLCESRSQCGLNMCLLFPPFLLREYLDKCVVWLFMTELNQTEVEKLRKEHSVHLTYRRLT